MSHSIICGAYGRRQPSPAHRWLHASRDTAVAKQRAVRSTPWHHCRDRTTNGEPRDDCETWHCPGCNREMPWCWGCGCPNDCGCEELCDECWTPLACATEAAHVT